MSSSVEEVGQHVRCHCSGRRSLDILKEVQKAYEDRLERIETMGGANTQKLVTSTLRSWVTDLISQNQLLVKTVEDLELEITSRILEAKKYHEMMLETKTEMSSLRRRMTRKDEDYHNLLKVIHCLRDWDVGQGDIKFWEVTKKDIFGGADSVDSSPPPAPHTTVIQELQNQNADKDKYFRQIEKLKNELLETRGALGSLTTKLSGVNLFDCPSTNDVAVMADLCVCSDNESQLSLRLLREQNMDLIDEMNALKEMCVKLELDYIEMAKRNQFCDAIIKEMTQQLKKSKDKKPTEATRKLTEDRRTLIPRPKGKPGNFTSMSQPAQPAQPVLPKSDPDLSKTRFDGAGDNI